MNPIETLVNEFEKIIQWLVWDNWVWVILGPMAVSVYSIYLLIKIHQYVRTPNPKQNITKLGRDLLTIASFIVLTGLFNLFIPYLWQAIDKLVIISVTWISDEKFKDVMQAIRNYETVCIFTSHESPICLSYPQAILEGLSANAKSQEQIQLWLAWGTAQLAFLLYIVGLIAPYYIVKFSLAMSFVLGSIFIFSPIWLTTRGYFRRWVILLIGVFLGYLGLVFMAVVVSVVFTKLLIAILPTIQDFSRAVFYASHLLVATLVLLIVWLYGLRTWLGWVGCHLKHRPNTLAHYIWSLTYTWFQVVFKSKKPIASAIELSQPVPEDKVDFPMPVLPSRQVHKIVSHIKNHYQNKG